MQGGGLAPPPPLQPPALGHPHQQSRLRQEPAAHPFRVVRGSGPSARVASGRSPCRRSARAPAAPRGGASVCCRPRGVSEPAKAGRLGDSSALVGHPTLTRAGPVARRPAEQCAVGGAGRETLTGGPPTGLWFGFCPRDVDRVAPGVTHVCPLPSCTPLCSWGGCSLGREWAGSRGGHRTGTLVPSVVGVQVGGGLGARAQIWRRLPRSEGDPAARRAALPGGPAACCPRRAGTPFLLQRCGAESHTATL